MRVIKKNKKETGHVSPIMAELLMWCSSLVFVCVGEHTGAHQENMKLLKFYLILLNPLN